MSRIGKLPISLPAKVNFKVSADHSILIEGPKGKLSFTTPPCISVMVEGSSIVVTRKDDERFSRAMHGTTQRLLTNMIEGVTNGFRCDLEIQGVGLKSSATRWQSDELKLFLPFTLNDQYSILSVWTKGSGAKAFGYIGQLWKYLQMHKTKLGKSIE